MTSGQGPTQQPTGVPPAPGGAAAAIPLPPELQGASASKDDRTWGMIAHLAALAGFVFPFGNILGPLIVFLIKKDQSRFVAYHAKQSLWFQVFVGIAALVLVLIGMVVCVTIPVAILIGVGAMAYAIYGAIQVNGGKDFEYYWVGAWVRQP
jgi:hypothetical protein